MSETTKRGNEQQATGNGPEGESSPLPAARSLLPSPKRVPLIYIAGPYRPTKSQRESRGPYNPNATFLTEKAWSRLGDDEFIHANIIRAHDAGIAVVEAGGMPLTPHKCTEHMDGLVPDGEFIARDLGTYLPACDALWAIDGWRESEGAVEEVREAIRLGKALLLSERTMREFCSFWADGVMAKGRYDRFVFTHRELANMIANGQATLDRSGKEGA